jgi:DNA-binding NarL/FixJ family response regulator
MTDGVVQLSDFRNSAQRGTPQETRSSAAHELQLLLRQAKNLVTTLLRTDVDWDDETRNEFMIRLDREIDGIAAAVESRLSAPEELERGTLADAGSQEAFDNPMGVVALSNVLEAALVLGAVRGNSIRHLLNESNYQESWDAIKAALAEQIERSEEPSAVLAREILAPDGREELSKREFDVLGLLALGRSNKQIARELSITPNTVKTHVSSILGKLGAESRTQAALYLPGGPSGSRMRASIVRGPSIRRAAM